MNHCSESTQENFGNDSDMVNAMLLTLIDRCGDDDNLAYKMYEYIKSFPSKLNLDLDLDNAFSHLFRKEKLKKNSIMKDYIEFLKTRWQSAIRQDLKLRLMNLPRTYIPM